MATGRRLLLLLLLQLGAAVAAASCLLAASSCPVDAALPPLRDDASATIDDTSVQSMVVDGDVAAAVVSRGARRLGPARRLSDIPADAPASDDMIPADAPAPAASPAGDADAAAAGHPWAILVVAFEFVLFLLAALGGSLALALLVMGLIMGAVSLVKGAALLASAIADLYAAARTAHEKATRVHPLDDDAGH